MSVRVVCPECSKKFRTTEKYLGKMARCPGCRRAIEIVHTPKKPPPAEEKSYSFSAEIRLRI